MSVAKGEEEEEERREEGRKEKADLEPTEGIESTLGQKAIETNQKVVEGRNWKSQCSGEYIYDLLPPPLGSEEGRRRNDELSLHVSPFPFLPSSLPVLSSFARRLTLLTSPPLASAQ